jgi:hypothetical protein
VCLTKGRERGTKQECWLGGVFDVEGLRGATTRQHRTLQLLQRAAHSVQLVASHALQMQQVVHQRVPQVSTC